MIFTREFVKDNIWINFSETDYCDYSEDQNEDGIQYAKVYISIEDTDGLNKIADDIRSAFGLKPLFNDCEHFGDIDCDGWYDFYLTLQDVTGQKLYPSILIIAENTESDDKSDYYIDLSDKECSNILERLDYLLAQKTGESVDFLLDESKRAMAGEN